MNAFAEIEASVIAEEASGAAFSRVRRNARGSGGLYLFVTLHELHSTVVELYRKSPGISSVMCYSKSDSKPLPVVYHRESRVASFTQIRVTSRARQILLLKSSKYLVFVDAIVPYSTLAF